MRAESLDVPQRMIAAGLALAKKRGIENFTVRQVCSKAKVNLGLFHYHFSSRLNFNKEVLKELYKELMTDFDLKIPADLKPEEKLKNTAQIINKFTKNNASLLLSILSDILAGNKEMAVFLKNNFSKHIFIALSVIEECKRKNVLKNFNSLSILFFLAAPAAIPNIISAAFQKILHPKDYKKAQKIIKEIQSEKLANERFEIAMRGSLK